MKILHLITTLDPKLGGVSQALRTIIEGLDKIRVENSVVCLDNHNEEFIKGDTFDIFALGKGTGPWCYNKLLFEWLIKNLNAYDLVILHGLWLYPGYALYKAIEKLKNNRNEKVPSFVVIPHGMLDPYFQKAEGRKLKAIRNLIYWQLVEKNVINKSDALLFTSEEEMNLASTYFKPYQPKRKYIVSLGVPIPPKKVENVLFNPKIEKNYILFISRIHPKKGVDILIDAYSTIVAENKQKSIPNLVIAGPGLSSDFGKKVLESVQNNPLIKNRLSFPGMLTGDSKWAAFYNCEAFILPSHQENFGIAVVEAMSCCKSVLITDKVNIWREIKNENAGLIENDSKEGVKILLDKWICLSPQKKMEMNGNALKCYKTNFTIENTATKMYDVLTDILNSNIN